MKKTLGYIGLLLMLIGTIGASDSRTPTRPRPVAALPGTPCSERDFVQLSVAPYSVSFCQNSAWVSFGSPLKVANGSTSAPTITGATTNAGFSFNTTSARYSSGGSDNGLLLSDSVALGSAGCFTWSSTTSPSGTADLKMCRNGVGALRLDSSGTQDGSLMANAVTLRYANSLQSPNSTASVTDGLIAAGTGGVTNSVVVGAGSTWSGGIQFFPGGSERLRIQTSGVVSFGSGITAATTALKPFGNALAHRTAADTVPAFSTLTACSSTGEGAMIPVSDSSTNVWGATVTGGGANHVLAYCDGTNWTVMAK